jgi:hypothetical protein
LSENTTLRSVLNPITDSFEIPLFTDLFRSKLQVHLNIPIFTDLFQSKFTESPKNTTLYRYVPLQITDAFCKFQSYTLDEAAVYLSSPVYEDKKFI